MAGVFAVPALAVVLAAVALSIAPARAEQALAADDRPAIRVAVEGAYPPFNFIDQNNELQGFEVDLLKALCDVMRTRCTLVQHEWEGIIRGLISREYDAVMSSLEITERRRRRIAFSRRYYLIPPVFIGPKDSTVTAITPEALAGRSIGAADRSEHAAFIEHRYKGSELRVYGKLDEANLDLFTGRIDLVAGDKLALSRFLQSREGQCCRIIADIPVNPAFHGFGYGVGFRKEDEGLRAQFDAAIEQIMRDGTYDRIRAKYFPFDIK